MEDRSIEYLKLEFGKLNQEISKLIDEIRIRERYAATFAPLAGAWIFVELLSSSSSYEFKICLALIICLATFLITFLFGICVLLLYNNIKITGKYLKKLEEHFITDYSNSTLGWERFYGAHKKGMMKIAVINWIAYLSLPIIMGLIVRFWM